jgi:hypothetical protein
VQISADGTVTFSDPPPQFSKDDVDRVLQDAQVQMALLGRLEKEMARSKEYLSKVRSTFFTFVLFCFSVYSHYLLSWSHSPHSFFLVPMLICRLYRP